MKARGRRSLETRALWRPSSARHLLPHKYQSIRAILKFPRSTLYHSPPASDPTPDQGPHELTASRHHRNRDISFPRTLLYGVTRKRPLVERLAVPPGRQLRASPCFCVKPSNMASDYKVVNRMFVRGSYLPLYRLYLLFVPTHADHGFEHPCRKTIGFPE